MARALSAWAINRGGKNSIRNLRYGPRTRLVRGIYGTDVGQHGIYYLITHHVWPLIDSSAISMLSNGLFDEYPILNYYMEDNTWVCVDMEFLFECSPWYFTSERSESVRYQVKHGGRYKQPCIILLWKMLKATFWRFSEDFYTLSEDFRKVVRRPDNRFGTFPENFRERTDDVSIIQ